MLPVSDFDGPWKEALDIYLPDIVTFFFPAIGAEVDWSRGYKPLDKELQQVAPPGDTGGQAVDKLIQVALIDGSGAWALIRLEARSQPDRLFAEPMFRYHARLFDHYRRQIVSLAILGDDRVSWRPASFGYDRWGCALNLTFPTAKLLDDDINVLEADPDPCATVVLAHLTAQATRRDPERRARAKVDLARRLYRLGYDRERIVQLFRFIEWLLRLPPELEERTWREIRAFEEAEQMTYITYGERIGLERGRVEGLQEAIAFGLELRFGAIGAALLPEIGQIADPALLHEIMARLKTATTLDDVRAVISVRWHFPPDSCRGGFMTAIAAPLLTTFDTETRIATVTLNRPEKRNPLSLALMEELIATFRAIGTRRDVAVVILAANGPAFSAGHDLAEMTDRSVEEYRTIFDRCCELMAAIQAIPQPVIAMVRGIATAAGCQLVATCDLVVAEEGARFGTPGVKIGLFCSTPMVALSRTIGQKRAMQMLLTGALIDARTAADWGLVNEVVPAEQLLARTHELAAQIATASPLVLGIGKEAFYAQIDRDQGAAYDYAKTVMTMNALADDAQEGIGAFLAKRPPRWTGR